MIYMLFNRIFRIIPECHLKNKVRCFFYSLRTGNDFRVDYNKCFVVTFDNIQLRFSHNPYYPIKMDLESVKSYLKKYKLKKGDVVIDGGSYIGLFTLMASKMVGDGGKVISFEPDAKNYKNFVDNLKVNNITNVTPVNKGLWSKDTILQLQAKGIGASFFSGNINDPIVSVPVVSLDNELKRLKVNKVDFIKMDVEGAEIEAVKGCKNILKNNDVKLAIASYHIVNGQQTCFELKKLFTKVGYKSEVSLQKPLITYANR